MKIFLNSFILFHFLEKWFKELHSSSADKVQSGGEDRSGQRGCDHWEIKRPFLLQKWVLRFSEGKGQIGPRLLSAIMLGGPSRKAQSG